jgi:16S rRNA (cytosine967-C5)-methyltransferase
LNAVLRRAAREGPAMIAAQDAPALDTPEWLRESWAEAHGSEIAAKLAAASLTEASLDISAKSDAAAWSERLGGTVVAGNSIRLEQSARIEELDGFEEGEWWVQDAAAALPARLLGDIAGRRVADLCAAPGGKTAQLASLGARVTAVDISGNRLGVLKDNLDRLKLGAEVVESDALAFAPDERFDAVLLDAPCSATGTIRRHPDIPHLKAQTDVARLAKLQERLLEKSLGLAKPGGTILYCTCSLQREEGEAQIEKLMAKGLPVAISPIESHEAAGLSHSISDRGFLRTWPFSGGPGGTDAPADGFFVARLVAG